MKIKLPPMTQGQWGDPTWFGFMVTVVILLVVCTLGWKLAELLPPGNRDDRCVVSHIESRFNLLAPGGPTTQIVSVCDGREVRQAQEYINDNPYNNPYNMPR